METSSCSRTTNGKITFTCEWDKRCTKQEEVRLVFQNTLYKMKSSVNDPHQLHFPFTTTDGKQKYSYALNISIKKMKHLKIKTIFKTIDVQMPVSLEADENYRLTMCYEENDQIKAILVKVFTPKNEFFNFIAPPLLLQINICLVQFKSFGAIDEQISQQVIKDQIEKIEPQTLENIAKTIVNCKESSKRLKGQKIFTIKAKVLQECFQTLKAEGLKNIMSTILRLKTQGTIAPELEEQIEEHANSFSKSCLAYYCANK